MDKKKKILLVEDEPDFRLSMRMRLEANGFEVIEADNGKAGLDMARTSVPDLIVLDVMLPKMDGYQVARLLKFDAKYKNIPIVMLTARTQKDDKQTGISVGADAYITKPFKAEELLEMMTKLLSK